MHLLPSPSPTLLLALTLPLTALSSGLLFPHTQLRPLAPQAPLSIPLDLPNPFPKMPDSSGPLLSDTLPLTRRINIFASLLRDHPSLPELIATPNNDNQGKDTSTTNFTILAPLNSAMQALPHKPWESPQEYNAMGAEAYAGEEGGKRAAGNVGRFVERHVLRVEGVWEEGKRGKTMGGREVWWEGRKDEDGKGEGTGEGKRVIMPDEIEVVEVASRVENGEVWVIKGVLGS